jgi:hypothetical protein
VIVNRFMHSLAAVYILYAVSIQKSVLMYVILTDLVHMGCVERILQDNDTMPLYRVTWYHYSISFFYKNP